MDTYFLGCVFLQRWSTFAWEASIKKGKTLEATEEEEEGRGEVASSILSLLSIHRVWNIRQMDVFQLHDEKGTRPGFFIQES